MRIEKILPVLILVLIFGACNPIEIEPDFTDSPVFSVDFKVNNIQRQFTAGENDYYQFTGRESNGGITDYFGELRQESCSDICEPSLKISFRGHTGKSIDLLRNSNFTYKERTPAVKTKARVMLEAVPFGEAPFEHSWEFEDPDIQNLTGDQVVVDFESFTKQKIKLTSKDGSGCENISEREIDLTDLSPNSNGCPEYVLFVEPMIDSSGGLDPNFFVFIFSDFGPPDSLQWHDGTNDFVNHFNIDSLNSEICATVFDFGCEETFCISMTPKDSTGMTADQGICTTQFTAEKELIFETGDSLQIETVFVEYINESGKVFNSEITYQPSNSYFSVTNVSSYDLNEKNEPTVKFDIEFECKLASEDGEVISIESGKGTFGILE